MALDTIPDIAQLDKYASDARAWREFADVNYAASVLLLTSDRPFLWFAAATLGHHALEMFLKAALICEGMTVCDPRKIPKNNPTLKQEDCAWDITYCVWRERLEGNDLSSTFRL